MKINLEKTEKLAKTVRVLSADIVEKAKSGHPGMPMGTADMAAVLWAKFVSFNPADPSWLGRDRFVLSAGHGSALIYSLLHLFGYDLPMSELKNFRQWGSKTPGHPEAGVTAGVEVTSGPLGQGFANGVGFALSNKMLAARYSEELFAGRVFGIVSDGDLMEGVSSEAASLAAHLKLGNINYLYDDNQISIGGRTDVCFGEDVAMRFEAYGWHVQKVDGHDLAAVAESLEKAVEIKDRPSLICARTIIGSGSPNKADSSGVHGSPLGAEEMKLTKEALGWPDGESFYVPEDVLEYCSACVLEKGTAYKSWNAEFQKWSDANSDLATLLKKQLSRKVPAELKDDLLAEFSGQAKEATRSLSSRAIQVLAKHLPGFAGGSADLEPSNLTLIKDSTDISAESFTGRNIRFGVREHAMGSIVNGMAYTGAWMPYGATFLVFSDYFRPAIRIAALAELQSFFVLTHDSFFVGEDGPTHQPVEHASSLRCIPNLNVYRPADGVEVAMSYLSAVQRKDGPAAFLLTRQGLPPIERPSSFVADDVLKGAYLAHGEEAADTIIVATGSEVWVAVAAAKELAESGTSVSVVSMPCMELFLEQDMGYQAKLLPESAKKVLIEAGTSWGWEKVVGSDALLITKDSYGASAPAEILAEQYGFSAETVAKRIKDWA